jgi:hypothetical protein
MVRKPDRSWRKGWRVAALAAACVVAGFLVGTFVFWKLWRLPPSWGDVPTWILAFGAGITAWYAIRAYSKQSREVDAIEQQVSDGQKVAEQQTKLLAIQSEQLELQRKQLDEQRKVDAEQLRVLVLQEQELRESLAERKREAVERRSAQAARVLIVVKVVKITPKGFDTGFRLNVTVVNASEQHLPIYRAALYWYSNGEPYGVNNPEFLGTVLEQEAVFRDFQPGLTPDGCGAVLTFRDAAGVDWIRQAEGGLMHAASDIAPDLIRAMYATSRNGSPPAPGA